MLRNDGKYTIFVIQHEQPEKGKESTWVYSNLDVFGYPEGFSASDDCWQKTGIHGTFDAEQAMEGLSELRKKNKDKHRFRLALVRITQITTWLHG